MNPNADTSSGDERTAAQVDAENAAVAQVIAEHREKPWQVVAGHAIQALDAHRAARTSEGKYSTDNVLLPTYGKPQDRLRWTPDTSTRAARTSEDGK